MRRAEYEGMHSAGTYLTRPISHFVLLSCTHWIFRIPPERASSIIKWFFSPLPEQAIDWKRFFEDARMPRTWRLYILRLQLFAWKRVFHRTRHNAYLISLYLSRIVLLINSQNAEVTFINASIYCNPNEQIHSFCNLFAEENTVILFISFSSKISQFFLLFIKIEH